jgi:hypothetical protein
LHYIAPGCRLMAVPIRAQDATHSDLRLTAFLGSNTVRKDGQIAVSVALKDSWFLGAGVLDPESGTLRRLPLRYDADLFSLSWNQKNEIVTGAFLMRSSIWRLANV